MSIRKVQKNKLNQLLYCCIAVIVAVLCIVAVFCVVVYWYLLSILAILSDEEIEWAKDIMTGVITARTTLEAARRPRGTRSYPALSCRDLRTSHINLTDGMNSSGFSYAQLVWNILGCHY